MPRSFIFTVLPKSIFTDANGGPVLRVSMVVSMRLTPTPVGSAGKLGDFALGNFTTTMRDTPIVIEFLSGGTSSQVRGTLANSGDEALDPTLWSRIFPDSTPVRPYRVPDYAAKRLYSYPVADVHREQLALYEGLAETSADDFPLLRGDFANFLATLESIHSVATRLERNGKEAITDDQVLAALPNSSLAPQRALAFYRAYRFYKRRLHLPPAMEAPFPPKIPNFDFHEMVALLGDDPILLRKLGLILDLDIPATNLPQTGTMRAFVRPLISESRAPQTAYRWSSSPLRFVAETQAGSDLVLGMLNLQDEKTFSVLQTDVDGTALKVLDFAANMRGRAQNQSKEQVREPVPSLRSAGVAIARRDRKTRLSHRFARQNGLNSALTSSTASDIDALPLYADDLLRGYRVDVEIDGAWRSLCQRDGTYVVEPKGAPTTLGPYRDEGYVKGASVTGDADSPEDLYLHETMFGWEGYSLVAPRPGRAITFDKNESDPRKQEPAVKPEPSRAQAGVNVETSFKAAKGTLPRLRFGKTYRFRARAVDLAGNSRPLNMPVAESRPSAAISYRRYEPVAQPVLVYRTKVSEGESIENLVIRSDRGVTVKDYIARPELALAGYRETCERHVAAPKATQLMCETHGAFDEIIKAEDPSTHAKSYLIALKESGTFQDREVLDPATGTYLPVTNITLESTPKTPAASLGVWPTRRGEPLAAGQYVTHGGETVRLPYLPDPLASGVSLYVPESGKLTQWTYQGAWPDVTPFRLVVRESEASATEPAFSTGGGVLEVTLPHATILRARYSSIPRAEWLPLMGLFDAISKRTSALELARAGLHWMLSPYREITFVHAVQRPLEDPKANVLEDATRSMGQTYATLKGDITCHGRSTSQLDLRAYWVDPVDLVTTSGPEEVLHEAHVAQLSAGYADTNVAFDGLQRHELSDTKHHRVVYQAVGATRYREYFPREIWEDATNITASEAVLEPPMTEGDLPTFTKESVRVLSTARPDAPKVLYAVPLFKWENSHDGKQLVRRGGALRIYLERPWYSSGVGELLAVLVAPKETGTGIFAFPKNAAYASQWGSDPLRPNLAPQNVLTEGHFRNPVAVGKGLTVPEGGNNLTAVGYEAFFHPERKVWYVDVELETGTSYFPFLRLSLARFQPDSIAGVELSSTVRGEFMQVAPNRVTTLTRDDDLVTVTVVGPTGDNTDGGDQVNAVLKISDASYTPITTDPILPPDAPVPQIVVSPELPKPSAVSDVGKFKVGEFKPASDKALRHVVRARIEAKTGTSDLDWTPKNDGVELGAFQRSKKLGEIVWRGELAIPSEVAESPSDFRIAIHEYEVYGTDPDVALSGDDPTVHRAVDRMVASRLVFAAHMAIPK